MKINNSKAKLLLDVCCGICFAGVFEQLKDKYEITAYWHNANIFPEKEYQKRLKAYQYSCSRVISTIVDSKDWSLNHKSWLKFVKANEYSKEPEGDKRCLLCYQYRLEKVAACAKKNGFNLFASTLTISPHKNAVVINKIGLEIEGKILSSAHDDKPKFLTANFKKKDGFKIANKISKELNIYRQNYCGCEFSVRNG